MQWPRRVWPQQVARNAAQRHSGRPSARYTSASARKTASRGAPGWHVKAQLVLPFPTITDHKLERSGSRNARNRDSSPIAVLLHQPRPACYCRGWQKCRSHCSAGAPMRQTMGFSPSQSSPEAHGAVRAGRTGRTEETSVWGRRPRQSSRPVSGPASVEVPWFRGGLGTQKNERVIFFGRKSLERRPG